MDKTQAQGLQDEIVDLRRRLHIIPELGFREYETREFLSTYMQNLGFRIADRFSSTALVVDLGEAPFVAIRSDMDALALHEKNVSSYVSQNHGMMHACGHDAHMACSLAAAKLLAENSNSLAAGVRLIFEPGTESADRSGAQELIEDGALSGVEGIIGFHVDNTLNPFEICVVKEIGVRSKRIIVRIEYASNDQLRAENLILHSSRIICSLKEELSGTCGRSHLERLVLDGLRPPQDPGKTEQYEIHAVLNAESQEGLNLAVESVKEICKSFNSEVSITLELERLVQPVGVQVSSQIVQSVAEEICPKEQVKITQRQAWLKGFELYAQKVPSAFFYLGTRNGARSHHSSTFEIDERPLYLATAILAQSVWTVQQKKESISQNLIQYAGWTIPAVHSASA